MSEQALVAVDPGGLDRRNGRCYHVRTLGGISK